MAKYMFKDRETDVYIDAVRAFDNKKYNGIRIKWFAAGIGFGSCDVLFEDDENGDPKITADTECMCGKDDKEFLRALFEEMVNKAEVIE